MFNLCWCLQVVGASAGVWVTEHIFHNQTLTKSKKEKGRKSLTRGKGKVENLHSEVN